MVDDDYEEQSTEEDEEIDEGTSEEESDDSNASDEDESEESIQEIRRNPRRGTRKVKITKAEFSSEDEADKSFWNQDFWKDDADQGKTRANEYVDKGMSSSEDFSEESEGEEPEPEPEKKRREPKKRKGGVYRDPRLHKKRTQAPRKRKREPVPTQPSRASSRKATKIKSEALAHRLEIEKEERKYRSAQPRKKRRKKPKMTQAERMREARKTEVENERSLALLLKIEDEAKQVDKKVRVIPGPVITTYSSKEQFGGKLLVGFKDCTAKAHFKLKERPISRRQDLCVVTKRKARYLDPLTGLPYCDVASFKTLRKQKKLKTKPT